MLKCFFHIVVYVLYTNFLLTTVRVVQWNIGLLGLHKNDSSRKAQVSEISE